MDESGKQSSLAALARIIAGGGTDPREALDLIANRRLEACGLVFISDGRFNRTTYRADCRATVFAIDQSPVDPSSPLYEIADPFSVGPNFSPKSIRVPYFEPEPRDRFFEPGVFTPFGASALLPTRRRLPFPDMQLDGNAVTFAKEDADLVAVRPRLNDPVLAFGEAGEGYVAEMTTSIPADLVSKPEFRKSVEAWIERLVPYGSRDRYSFTMVDIGHAIDMQISIADDRGPIPDIEGLDVVLQLEDGSERNVPMFPVEGSPSTFKGQIRIRDEETHETALILTESGSDALLRPQRVPFLMPSTGSLSKPLASEDLSQGVNMPLLLEIAGAGGGQVGSPFERPLFIEHQIDLRQIPIWPWLLVAGMVFYLPAIAIHRWRPVGG